MYSILSIELRVKLCYTILLSISYSSLHCTRLSWYFGDFQEMTKENKFQKSVHVD